MALTASEIQIILRMRDEATQKANRFISTLQSVGKIAAGVAGGLGLGALISSLTGAAGAVVDFNSRMEQSRMAFTTMLGSGEAAEAFLQRLQKFAATTPFEFPELVDASRKMLAFGFSADQVLPLLTAVGNTTAAMGSGAAGIDRITSALGQMQAKAKVSGEEMLQLTEQGIPAWQILADAIGKTVPETQKLVEQGKIASGVFIRAFEDFSKLKFGDMMQKQAGTFQGAMSTIKDSLLGAAGSAFEPIFQRISELAQRIAQFVQSDQFAAWAQSVRTHVEFALQALGVLAEGFASAFDSIARIVLSVGAIILQAFALINPFTRHSPSLVEQVEMGFDRIAGAIGDLPGRVLPPLRMAGDAMKVLGEAAGGTLADMAAKADAALLKQIGLLGSGAVPAYIAARDRLMEVQGALAAVSDELERQQGILSDMETALEPLEDAFDTAKRKVDELKDALGEAESALRDLVNAPLEGENASNQEIFGLRNALNIKELERAKLIQAGANEDEKRSLKELQEERERLARAGKDTGAINAQIRLKQLDQEIEQHKEAIRIAELEARVKFDGQRNYIEQVAQAGRVHEQTQNQIIARILEEKQKIAELGPAIAEATAQQQAASDAVEQQKLAIEAQKGIVEGLQENYKTIAEQAELWQERLEAIAAAGKQLADEMERAARAAAKAAGGGPMIGGGIGPISEAFPELPKPGELMGGLDLDELKRKVGEFRQEIEKFTQPLKDLADNLQLAAGGGKSLSEAFGNIKKAWDEQVTPALALLKKWWDDEGRPTLVAFKEWIDHNLPEAYKTHQTAVNQVLIPGLKAIYAEIQKRAQPWLVLLEAFFDTLLPEAFKKFEKARVAILQVSINELITGGLGVLIGKLAELGVWFAITLPGNMEEFGTKVSGFLTGTGETLRKFFAETLPTAIGDAQTKYQEMINFLGNEFTKAIEAAKTSGPLKWIIDTMDLITKAIETAQRAWDALKRAFENPPKLPSIPNPFAGGNSSGAGGGARVSSLTINNTQHFDQRGMDPRRAANEMTDSLAVLSSHRLLSGAM